MIDIVKKEICCGCYACSNACPRNCITMVTDNEGFDYPVVNKSSCINCNLCDRVCPFKNDIKRDEKNRIDAYACINKDDKIRNASSSGGIFYILCEYVIEKNGVVFGAAFDKEFNVKHTYAETIQECNKFRGSKYVQSKIGETYKLARKFLDNKRVVLFSGTQCQIKGLKTYLGKQYENLITIDIVCHGVPSQKVLNLYNNSLIKKYKSNIKSISFRDKRRGWKEFSYVAEFENGKVYSKNMKEDTYMQGFLQNLYLRPSCYRCKAKNFTSGSDISLADYWGVKYIHQDLDDDKGTSLVLVNSNKGEEIFKELATKIIMKKTNLDYAVEKNPCIVKSVQANAERNMFFKNINTNNIEKNINRCINKTILYRVKLKIISYIKRNNIK